MLCFWAAKGGSGCSSVSAAVAIMAAQARSTLLVDLAGDLPALLALEDERPGVTDWLGADRPPPDALSRLEVDIGEGLSLLPFGRRTGGSASDPLGSGVSSTSEAFDRVSILARLLADDDRAVVVDLGCHPRLFDRLVDLASISLLVTRPCFLALRRAENLRRPDGVVVILEPGRSLRPGDVAEALAAPIEATMRLDSSVARAIDAGTLLRRLPRSLARLQVLADKAVPAKPL